MSRSKQAVKLKIALAGNSNVGKSVIFNEITGGRAFVANWPGVTVEKKVGRIRFRDVNVEVVDLPGIYSLTPYTLDEMIARRFIIEEKPDAIINIVNAVNLDRNLYLTILLLEMKARLVIALNMMDLAEAEGIKIDVDGLSRELGVPIIPTIAVKGVGTRKVLEEAVKIAKSKQKVNFKVDYGGDVEKALRELTSIIEREADLRDYEPRWLAIKLLEGDENIVSNLKSLGRRALLEKAERMRAELERKLNMNLEDYMIEKRYELVFKLVSKYVIHPRKKATFTDLLDSVLTSRIYGIPILATIVYMMFQFAFKVAEPFMTFIDWLFGTLLYEAVYSTSLPLIVKSFLADGFLVGVGSILVFVPNIALLFLALAVLEDIGYMARAAYVVDKIMHKLKLTGKSIVPMAVGFGCNVPAIMATRPIEDEADRKVTALVAPLMSCMARLPVYLVVGGAFFAAQLGVVVMSMYVLGVLLAFVMAWILRKVFFKAPSSGFIMELPPYLAPTLKGIVVKTWERTKRFLLKAGTVILFAMFLVWVMSVTGPSGWIGVEALSRPELLEESWVGVLGRGLQSVFWPMGWDWRALSALLLGFVAKEIVVGSMAILYGAAEEELPRLLSQVFTPVQAYAYMAFVLIYVPCLATLAAIRSELGTRYMLLALFYELALAYVVALLITGFGALWGGAG